MNPLEGKPCGELICSPAKQTNAIRAFGAMTKVDLIDLFKENLFTGDGRINFIKKYNAIDGISNIVWSQVNEDELEAQYAENEMRVFHKFFKFKAEFDKVNTLMISMLEGLHRLLCLLYTLLGRKVHALTDASVTEPTSVEKLSVEYLKSVGKHTNENILVEEGTTWVMQDVEQFMTSVTDALMVNMNLSVPLVSNSSNYTVSGLLKQCLEESKKYAETKKNSSSRSDFAHIAETLGKVYKKGRFTGAREVSDTMEVGDGVQIDVTPKAKKREEWVKKMMANLIVRDPRMELQLRKIKNDGNGEWVTCAHPLKQDNYKQMFVGKSTETDLGELNQIVIGRCLLDYCMKKFGSSSQEEIDKIFETILEKRLFNLSTDRRWLPTTSSLYMGEDASKGVAAAAFVLAMHTVGGIYDCQIEVHDFFKNLGFAHSDQIQHWGGMSK